MDDQSLIHSHNVSVLSNLKPGDLVEFPRGIFSHWAVYIGNEEVVHLAGVDDGGSDAGVRSSASSFSICGALFNKAKVCRDNFWKVAEGSKARINNSKDGKYGKWPLSVEEIVKNALSKLGDVGYNLICANCECFAKWCRYGIAQSDQVEQVMTGAAVGLAGAAVIGIVYAFAKYFKNDENEEEKKQKVAIKR